MITFDELAPLWLRRVVPKEAERGAIGLQMVASSSEKKNASTLVWWAGSCRAPPALLPQFQRAHLSTKLPVLVHTLRQFCQCLWLYA
jgi:hypothetical protein